MIILSLTGSDVLKQETEDRTTFQEIVEELKDDKYAIEEFGMKTLLDEYQKRIDSYSNIDKFKSIFFPRSKEKNPDNHFIDENEEKHHQFLLKIGEGATLRTKKKSCARRFPKFLVIPTFHSKR